MFGYVKIVLCWLVFYGFVSSAEAAVIAKYATNTYQNHELSRAEQKCIDDGYKVTYANCPKLTAPVERCPHHRDYYKDCSKEQWCKNNNYSYKDADCETPFYPFKMCTNEEPMYRICKEDLAKACEEKGFVSKQKCQLTDKKCPYSADYGVCCDNCPDFSHALTAIPQGYVAVGETCTTCDGITKTNITPAACEGFKKCKFGPMSPYTSSCLQGETILYSACKTSAEVCNEKGYTVNSCSDVNDTVDCPENPNFKLCIVNCLKQAKANNPNADVIAVDVIDPVVDLIKTEMNSLVGMDEAECQNQSRPNVMLHINSKNIEMYRNLFERKVENINFNLIFEEPISLSANGILKNVKITASGNMPECPLKAEKIEVEGVVSFMGIPTLCADFNVASDSKLISTGGVRGNVDMAKDASLGLKGDLKGYLKAKSNAEILIKGALEYKDEENRTADTASIVFGCNSKVRIEKGIVADTSSIFLKQWVALDTPSIKFISTSENPELYNTLASLHMYRYAKIYSADGDTVYPLSENDGNQCDDIYFVHLGSASDKTKQEFVFEPSNLFTDNLQCRPLDYKQQECN